MAGLTDGKTRIDISWLRPALRRRGIRTHAQVEKEEAANILKAMLKYLAKRPTARQAAFDITWARKLHREMFGDVWKWAGQFRTYNTNLGIDWRQVETALQSLLDDLPAWEGLSLLEQAARLHYRAVHIHPFPDGNGRWSRMLANIWLRRHGHEWTRWSDDLTGKTSKERGEYLSAIRAAGLGDESPLVELHRRNTPTNKPV